MRRTFFRLLHEAMAKDERIVFLTGDLGFSLIEPIRDSFPDRFYNMQAAEFAMVGAAIGLAYEGKIPVVYTIAPFAVLRPFELLRTYVNHEKVPIKLVGVGRDDEYKGGISHYAGDISDFLDPLGNIDQFWPDSEAQLGMQFHDFMSPRQPSFLSLSK